MEGQKILKQPRAVTFTLSDGSIIRGDVFLHLCSFYESTQQLSELLNDDEVRFIPVKQAPENSVILLNLDHVVLVEEERQSGSDRLDALIGKWRAVTVKVPHRGLVQGEILIDLPSDHMRAQDFFNRPVRFSELYQQDRILYVNHDHIVSVTD
jgi:hypothetical protein